MGDRDDNNGNSHEEDPSEYDAVKPVLIAEAEPGDDISALLENLHSGNNWIFEDNDEDDLDRKRLEEEIAKIKKDLKRTRRLVMSKVMGDLGGYIGNMLLAGLMSYLGFEFHKKFPYHIKPPERPRETSYIRRFLNLLADNRF
uniref:Uncharacterized protein n=2 Tax=Lotharella oceanica TaxID=641309 RepID=A0A7S2TLL1_9EUKA